MKKNSGDDWPFRRVATVVLCALLFHPAPSAASQRREERPNEQGFQLLTGFGTDIGVVARELTASDTHNSPLTGGVALQEVRKDSSAARAGLKPGDIVVEFDGEAVHNQRQFSLLVQQTPPGRTVNATVVRSGQRTRLSIAVPPALRKQR